MKLSNSLLSLLGVALGASSLIACVYASDAPTPISSGTGATSSTNGTDPGNPADGDGGGGGGGGGDDAGGGGGGSDDAGAQTGKDAGTHTGTDAGQTSSGLTWTNIYAGYFAAGSMGNCGASGCHASSRSGVKCADKATCYSTLTSSGYISGASSPLADTQQSCLTWFTGNMPPSGGASAKAKTDISAWVAAGALNN